MQERSTLPNGWVIPSFCATTTRTHCACMENKYIKEAVTARLLRQRGNHATLSALAGKLDVKLGKSVVLLRFIHNNCKAVRRMRAVSFFFVISKSNQW